MGRTATLGLVLAGTLLVACRSRKAEVVPEQVTVRYCATTVQVRNVERCLAEIPAEQQRRRERTTRLSYRNGQLQRREVVSGSGELLDVDVESYEYAANRLVAIVNTSRTGVPVGRETFSPDGLVSNNFDERGRPKPYGGRDVGGIRRVFDAAGFLQSAQFLDVAGKPAASDGFFEWKEKVNAQGVTTQWSYFGRDGEPVKGRGRAHRIVSEVDALGLEHSQKCFDEQSRPTLCEGAHQTRIRYDDAGNYIQLEFFDVENRPISQSEWGAAAVRITRDEHGNAVETRLFDERGQPTLGERGYACLKTRYDGHDRPVEYAYFGVDGTSIKTANGAALTRRTYDARGNETSVSFLDESGASALSSQGYFRVETEWDARDNAVTTRYRNVAQQPVLIKAGYAVEKRTYDGDRLVTYALLGVTGQPIKGRDGYARAELSYDVNGRRDMWRYFDLDGKQVGEERTDCRGSVSDAWKRELDARRSSFRACYQAMIKTGAKVSGKVAVKLQVDTQGKVTTASIGEDQIGNGSSGQCLLQSIRRPFAHGADRGCASIRLPLSFTPD